MYYNDKSPRFINPLVKSTWIFSLHLIYYYLCNMYFIQRQSYADLYVYKKHLTFSQFKKK